MHPRSQPMPDVPPGTEVQLTTDDWRYGAVKVNPTALITRALRYGPLWLRVQTLRPDLSGFYGGRHVWVNGWLLDEATGLPVEEVEALVRVEALTR